MTIGSVSLRLLPQPGFDLGNLVIGDDPAISYEPICVAGEVTASLRLSLAMARTTGDSAPAPEVSQS